MSGFDSGKAVHALDWNFSAHGGPKGTIPEPTQSAVEKFNRTTGDILPGGLKALLEMEPEEQETASALFKDAIAELAQNQPSREELDALPARVLTAFTGWLYGSIANPS